MALTPPPGGGARDAEVDRLVAIAAAALEAGQLETAGRTAEQATRIDPSRREPWLLLCSALSRIGSADVEKAMAMALRHFPQDDPLRPMLEADRARALLFQERFREAADQARSAAARPGVPPLSHKVLSATFAQLGLYDDALRHARMAAEALPDDALVNFNLANAHRFLGDLGEAEAIYERALAQDPDETLIYTALASLRKWTPEQNHVEALRGAIARAPGGTDAQPRLRYALFKELDDLGRRDEAWAALAEGSALARHLFGFNPADQAARTQAIIDSYPKARFQTPPAHRPDPPRSSGPRPIFVFGLPRSGTTLVERILSAHSRVTAMGETSGFPQAVKAASRTPGRLPFDVATIRASANADFAQVARLYQDFTAYLSKGADVVTEKLPQNYEYAGPMRLAFPEASLVHVRRSPMDSLFGAYRLMFGQIGHHWSYSLEDLAANYRHYRRLMDHWRDALGGAMTEITLETLIENPEAEITRLLAACGLDFEAACLSPESAGGGVSTASSAQVRKPINRQGMGAWRRYAAELEPLRAELERGGYVDADGEPVWG